MGTWAEDEVQTADLEDRRLNKRLALLLEQLGEHPQLSIPAACGGWKVTMGAYRFFDNEKTSFKKILAPHRDATVERMKSSPVVLLAQDTTEYFIVPTLRVATQPRTLQRPTETRQT